MDGVDNCLDLVRAGYYYKARRSPDPYVYFSVAYWYGMNGFSYEDVDELGDNGLAY
jgi:hypothetical protein